MTRYVRFDPLRVLLCAVWCAGCLVVPSAVTAEEHSLDPAIRLAKKALSEMESIKDYSATMVKRERVDGKLLEHEYAYIKVRHEPFSVYMYFVGPKKIKGREVLYVEGKNDGKLIAHESGGLISFVTVKLDPESPLAMRGNRYPITHLGIKNLAEKLVERADQDKKIGEPVEVKFFKGAKIDKRSVTCIQVTHPKRHPKHMFYKARVFIDEETKLPIRYEAYDWPKEEGGKPLLIEEYTYLKLDLNKGYTDEDFDEDNPNYNF
jgi:outer membrane lipoprotein-sorting protein